MTAEEARKKEVRDALEMETRPLFPMIYDEFVEADALAEGEDALSEIIKSAIYSYFLNRNLQTITEDAIREYERRLGITAGGTIEERRRQIAEIINRRFVMNDAALLEIIQALPGGSTNDFEVDARALVLQLEKKTNTEGEHEAEELKEALETAQPLIPMNVETRIAVLAENRIEANVIYGWTGGTISGLGEVKYISPPTLDILIDTITGAEKPMNPQPKQEFVDKGGTGFEGHGAPTLQEYQTSVLSVPKGGTGFDGHGAPTLQDFGTTLFFTIPNTPDA